MDTGVSMDGIHQNTIFAQLLVHKSAEHLRHVYWTNDDGIVGHVQF